MSTSPIAKKATQNQNIPSPNRVAEVINDANQLPANYSSSPGGTVYSTTPGGSRIVYDRSALMEFRNSPIASTPPSNLNSMPTNILKSPAGDAITPSKKSNEPTTPAKETPAKEDSKENSLNDEATQQFQMEM